MTLRNLLLLAVALAAGLAAVDSAEAHGRHRSRAHVGVFIGAPAVAWGWPHYHPYYYPPSYVVPAPVVVQPATPPVYIERADEQAAKPSGEYWYYCPDTRSYYPYVGTCASPWQRVAPQPPQS